MKRHPDEPGTELSEGARERILRGIERKLAAGHIPSVPADPLARLGSTALGAKLLVAVVGGAAVVGAVTWVVGQPRATSRGGAPRAAGPPTEAAMEVVATRGDDEPAAASPVGGEVKRPAVDRAPSSPGRARPEPPVSKDTGTGRPQSPRRGGGVAQARRPGGAGRPGLKARPTPTSAAPKPSGLAAELPLVERARAALDAGQPKVALDVSAEHTRKFPAGALAPERERVAIAALCALGRDEEARRRVERFVRRFPGSPLVPAVRASCGGGDPSKGSP